MSSLSENIELFMGNPWGRGVVLSIAIVTVVMTLIAWTIWFERPTLTSRYFDDCIESFLIPRGSLTPPRTRP